jgi:hypothetical protein
VRYWENKIKMEKWKGDQKLTESQREIQWTDLGVGGLKMTVFERSFHRLYKHPGRIKIGYVMDPKLRKLEE